MYRNGGIQSAPYPYKSSYSYENYQPQSFGVRSGHEPKMLSAFNSFGSIQNNGITGADLKMFPTATSMKSIPDTMPDESSKLQIFKNILMVAASRKWTEKDVADNWGEVAQLIKNGYQGSRRELEKYLTSHKTPQKKKRSKSQQCRKRINPALKRQTYEITPQPKFQRLHSYNYHQSGPQISRLEKQKAKSVEGRNKKQQQPKPSESKGEGLIKLCQDIELILGEGEKRLSV